VGAECILNCREVALWSILQIGGFSLSFSAIVDSILPHKMALCRVVGVWYVGSFTFSRLICTNCRFSIYYNKEEVVSTLHLLHTYTWYSTGIFSVCGVMCVVVLMCVDGGAVSTDKVREACSSRRDHTDWHVERRQPHSLQVQGIYECNTSSFRSIIHCVYS
jgi:hypothetical protein